MTETALNERIAALQEIDASAVRQREKARHRLRRVISVAQKRCRPKKPRKFLGFLHVWGAKK